MAEGINIRFLEVDSETARRLPPAELVEYALGRSGELDKHVYYDGGSAFMGGATTSPEDLTAFTEGVADVMRSMKRSIGSHAAETALSILDADAVEHSADVAQSQ